VPTAHRVADIGRRTRPQRNFQVGSGNDRFRMQPGPVRAAYRREMVNYHPDKVAHLGKELQELAKTKAQEINRAYEELTHSG